MIKFLFDCKLLLLIDILEHGATINAQRYVGTVKSGIMSKRLGMLIESIMQLQDNARPHASEVVSNTLQKVLWDAVTHPPYSQISHHAISIFLEPGRNTSVAVYLLRMKSCTSRYNRGS